MAFFRVSHVKEFILNNPFFQFLIVMFSFGICGGGSGCGSAVRSGNNTALSALDLKKMTDRMAASLAGNPQIRQAIQEHGQLKVVVEPARNEMTAEILPRGQAEAFTSRIRALLSEHDPADFQWIMNRNEFYDLRTKQREDTLGPSPDAINPQYALTAYFRSLTAETSSSRRSSYLCVYELADLRDRSVLWTDKYEVEKSAVKGFLD